MHSRIFILATEEEIKTDDYYTDLPSDEGDFCKRFGIDYVDKENEEQMEESVDWLKSCYNLTKVEKIKTNENQIIFKIDPSELKKGLMHEKIRRIQEVKDLLKKDDHLVDMWRISWVAYEEKGFYFIHAWDTYNSMGFLEQFTWNTHWNNGIYVVATYDYHY
jgi:hypothetical protein